MFIRVSTRPISNILLIRSYLGTWRLEQSSPTCNWRRSHTSAALWMCVPVIRPSTPCLVSHQQSYCIYYHSVPNIRSKITRSCSADADGQRDAPLIRKIAYLPKFKQVTWQRRRLLGDTMSSQG